MKNDEIFRFLKLPFFVLFTILYCYSDSHAENDTVLRQQLLIALTTFGEDTVFRNFIYDRNGLLHTIVDSAIRDYRVTYHAEFDSTGKIRTLKEFKSELIYSVDYIWESGNRIKYTKQYNSSPEIQTGTIIYYGRLRSVDLPENNPLATENSILVRADSTQYLDAEGKIITTWYWEYDSLDRCIGWKSCSDGSKIQWVEEYTYGYLRGLPARYPALEGEIVVFIYDIKTGLPDRGNISSMNKVFRKSALSSAQFMLNGRKVHSVTAYPEMEQKSSLIVVTQKDGKARIILPKGK